MTAHGPTDRSLPLERKGFSKGGVVGYALSPGGDDLGLRVLSIVSRPPLHEGAAIDVI